MWLEDACIFISLDFLQEVVPLDGSRAVVIPTVGRNLVFDGMDLLDIAAIEDVTSYTLWRWRNTSILPFFVVGSFEVVDFVLGQISFQSALRVDRNENVV